MLDKAAKVVTPLEPHQQRVVDKLQQANLLIAHGMGSGKTLSSIAAAEKLGLPTKVLTPASLTNNYLKEVGKHTVGGTVPYDVESINRAVTRNSPVTSGLLTIDEAHGLRNTGTKRLKYIKSIADKPSRLALLTGTPSYNNVSDIAPIINLLKGDTVLPENPADFNKKYVKSKTIAPGIIAGLLGVKPGVENSLINKKELADILRGSVDYHQSNKYFPSRKDTDVEVEMSPQQQKAYEYVEGTMPAWAKWKIRAGLPPSKTESKQLNSFMTGVRQASNTPGPYVAGMSPLEAGTASPKMLAARKSILDRLAKDKNFKALVYSNYREAGVDPMSALLTEKNVPHGVYHGGLSAEAKKDLVARYNAGDLKALLGTSSASEGLDLKGTKLVQVLEPHFNKAKLEQVVARAIRYKSHEHLPENERKVDVEHYYSSPKTGLLAKMLVGKSKGADRWLDTQATKKQELIDELTTLMKDVT